MRCIHGSLWKNSEMTRRLAVLTTSVKARDDRIKTLESKVAALEHESDKVEQYTRRPNLRFTGIAETDETNENTTEKILDIINEDMCPNVQIRPEQIERSHRLGAKTDRNGKIRQRAIIVRFGHENTRDAVYRVYAEEEVWSKGVRKQRPDIDTRSPCLPNKAVEEEWKSDGLLDCSWKGHGERR